MTWHPITHLLMTAGQCADSGGGGECVRADPIRVHFPPSASCFAFLRSEVSLIRASLDHVSFGSYERSGIDFIVCGLRNGLRHISRTR